MSAVESRNESNRQALDCLRLEFEAKLFSQEHRLFYILRNLSATRSLDQADPRRTAARDALIYRLAMAMLPNAAAAGVTLTAIVGLIIAYWANSLIQEQNQLLQKQNGMLNSQNRQFQASRVTQNFVGLFSQLMGLISEDEPQEADGAPQGKRKLSATLAARFRALCDICAPYEGLTEDGMIDQRQLSPERATILLSLTSLGLDMSVLENANFSFAGLEAAQLGNAMLSGIRLNSANLANAYLSGADMSNVDLWSANLSGADMSNIDLHGADLRGANLSNAHLVGGNLRDALLDATNLVDATIGSSLDGAIVMEDTFLDQLKKEGPSDYRAEEWATEPLSNENERDLDAISLGFCFRIVRKS